MKIIIHFIVLFIILSSCTKKYCSCNCGIGGAYSLQGCHNLNDATDSCNEVAVVVDKIIPGATCAPSP